MTTTLLVNQTITQKEISVANKPKEVFGHSIRRASAQLSYSVEVSTHNGINVESVKVQGVKVAITYYDGMIEFTEKSYELSYNTQEYLNKEGWKLVLEECEHRSVFGLTLHDDRIAYKRLELDFDNKVIYLGY